MTDIRRVRRNKSKIEILESIESIKYDLKKFETSKMFSLIDELKEEILQQKRNVRNIESLIELWQTDECIELNEEEFYALTEYLMLHDTGFRLVEVNIEYEHYLLYK